MIKVGFKRLTDNAILPVKAHLADSGFDLYTSEEVRLKPYETKVIPTDIAIKLPPLYEAQVRPRSGVTSKTKLRVQLGTIDNGYTGNIGITVDNLGEWVTTIPKGMKLAQLVIAPIPAVEVYEFTDDIETERGTNGFGSTGV